MYTAIFITILVRSPVSGLLEFEPPEVSLKQAQTEIKPAERSEAASACDIPAVFLGRRGSLGLCRASELQERKEQQEGDMTVSHLRDRRDLRPGPKRHLTV